MRDKVVWILGSGFSRSVGGPLLDELMGEARWERISQIAAFDSCKAHWDRLLWFYRNESAKETKQWRDAEEFIEWVELISLGHIPYPDVLANEFRGQPAAHVATMCRKYLAAVTWEFTSTANPDFERWQPYRAWATSLQSQDTVISFNWDEVAEKAYAAACDGAKLSLTLTAGELGQLNKVHGSIGWKVGPNQSIVVDDAVSVIASAAEHVLGVPGPAKMSSCGTILQPQWQASIKAIKEADAIIFVGYRFPPSDSYSRHWLIDSLRKNESQELTVRVVLGPKRDEHVVRVESLVQWALRGRQGYSAVIHEPLWAEDFLTVFDRERLASRELT